MPKITRHGGPTVAGAAVVAGGWSSASDPDVWPDLDAEAGEEAASEVSPAGSPEEPEVAAEEPKPKTAQRRTRSKS